MKKLAGVIVGTAVVFSSAAAFAEPGPSREPMDRAIEKVGENLAEHPDNRGLRNARQRLQNNQVRQSTRGKNHAPGQQKSALISTKTGNKTSTDTSTKHQETRGGPERTAVVDRVERVEQAARPDRPDAPGRPDTPGRPDAPGRPDNPGRPTR